MLRQLLPAPKKPWVSASQRVGAASLRAMRS